MNAGSIYNLPDFIAVFEVRFTLAQEIQPMITLRAKSLLVVATLVLSISGIAVAQHDVAGGSTSDTATAGDSSRATTRVRRTPRPATSARPRAAIRRGLTAEQYNLQGDTFFDAEQYDDALETYTKAVQLKPIASA